MFSLHHCLVSSYLYSTMRHKALIVGLLLLLLSCPSTVWSSQETQRDQYIVRIDFLLDELKDVTTTRHDLGRLQVFTTYDKMVPLNGEANLLSMVDIVDKAFELWRPTEERPLRVYFVDYETYREYAAKFFDAFDKLWPASKQPIPGSTFGFFVPLATEEDVYILYTWVWFVHLHEMFHVALTHHVSVLTGTNHGAVDPEVRDAWLSPSVQLLIDAATKGELG